MRRCCNRAIGAALSCTFLLLIGCDLSQANFAAVPNVTVFRGFVAEVWVADLPNVRSLVLDEGSGAVLGLIRGADSIYSFKQNAAGTSVDVTKLVDNSTLNLNHGLALHKGFLYASSSSAVYRWPYKANTAITTPPEIVVKNIPTAKDQEGRTRTLLFDGDKMYVSIGTNKNVDPDPTRSRVVWYDLANKIPSGGWDWSAAKKYADGLRNTVALALDGNGKLWGAECGADRLVRQDLGADLEQDNPAEEINQLTEGFFGFPYCFTAWNIPNATKPSDNNALEQYIWPSAPPDFTQKYTDDWCRERKNNLAPVAALPGHSVPIGMSFFDGKGCTSKSAFDCWMKGDLFVAMRGSWDKAVPNGFQVARVPMVNGKPTLSSVPTPLIAHTDYQKNCVTEGQKASCFRAVDVLFMPDGTMLIAVDISKGMIVRLSRDKTVSLSSDKAGSAAVMQFAAAWAMLMGMLSALWML